MPLVADRVKETSTTTGTGTLALAGAPTGFQTFSTAFGNGVTVYYVIDNGAEWEIGIGTTGAGTLSRDTVLQSTNGDALVNLTAGTKTVFCAYVADRAVTTSDAATLTNKIIDNVNNHVGADHIHYKVKATATITKGQTLKVTGYSPGEAAIEVAPVSSASDVAVGIAYVNLNSGDFGPAINTGLVTGVKTDYAGWAIGDILYPDPATGGLTKTKPSSGLYQACAYVMRVQSNNGVLLVEFTEPQYVAVSTNTNNTLVLRDGSGNFAAGTVTAALTGNASTATTLQTARNINGVSFNGSADITVTAANPNALTLGAGLTGTSYNGSAAVTATVDATDASTASKIVSRDAGGISSFKAVKLDGATSGTVTVQPAATAGTWSLTLPVNDGDNGQVLTTDGSGVTSWATPTASADAGTLTGTTLASNVVASSLTSVGTLTSLNVSNNVSIGATAKSWASAYRAAQIGQAGALFGLTNDQDHVGLTANAYFDTTDNRWEYIGTGAATRYVQDGGAHVWYQAASGNANAAVGWNELLRVDQTGAFQTANSVSKVYMGNFSAVAGYTSYDMDGLFAATASPCIITMPGDSQMRFGYYTQGNGEYAPRIGGIQPVAGGPAITYGSFGFIGNPASFTVVCGTTTRFWVANNGRVYVGGGTDRGAYNLQCNGTGVWGQGAYVNGSDARLKDDIAPIGECLAIVQALRPVTFRYKADVSRDTNIQPGFIAQDLQGAMADTPYVDGVVQAGPEFLNVAYQSIIPILTKAMQEQQAIIQTLEARIAALEA